MKTQDIAYSVGGANYVGYLAVDETRAGKPLCRANLFARAKTSKIQNSLKLVHLCSVSPRVPKNGKRKPEEF